MAEVQVLLETGKLKTGKLKETGRLVKELVDVRMSMSGAGRVRMGAEGYGEHDDLVIALALACWRAKGRQQIGERSRKTRRDTGAWRITTLYCGGIAGCEFKDSWPQMNTDGHG
jgi:hypothetical protein